MRVPAFRPEQIWRSAGGTHRTECYLRISLNVGISKASSDRQGSDQDLSIIGIYWWKDKRLNRGLNPYHHINI
ncbi:hypothetical protein chiPu_0019667 [Chiloscyllium punctatum]|uniref:Uncharacterized protein n=1 Tax=Chiloscyllium punctatum TaxID=137246 RepID=A0A401RST3_CHIPU|nr:hypothetical protein [Chiloscyllium punctatum]